MTAKLLLAACCFLALSVPAARACGGGFCTAVPMNQVAENILFIQGDGTITTHVQLQYSGAAADAPNSELSAESPASAAIWSK